MTTAMTSEPSVSARTAVSERGMAAPSLPVTLAAVTLASSTTAAKFTVMVVVLGEVGKVLVAVAVEPEE